MKTSKKSVQKCKWCCLVLFVFLCFVFFVEAQRQDEKPSRVDDSEWDIYNFTTGFYSLLSSFLPKNDE